jgi:transposase
MAKELVSDELWEAIEPLLPPKPQGGRPRLDDRAALTGIIFVLKSGIPWEMLPKRWAVALELRAGDACVSGRRQGSGSGCTGCSWIVLAKPTR